MLGDFITRGLVMLLGYAYPAFECYKTVERNKVEIEDLRFWCQYWIIVALLTVFERLGDIFVSWLPMYGEMKLALFIYLWYPKTKGTSYIYQTFLQPYVAAHETDIDRKLLELRARAWDLAIFYWENCTKLGQTTFVQVLQFLAAQSTKVSKNGTENGDENYPNAPPPNKQQSGKKWPPTTTTYNSAISQSPKSNHVKVHPDSQTGHIHTQDASEPEVVTKPGPTAIPETRLKDTLHSARQRLRRSNPIQ